MEWTKLEIKDAPLEIIDGDRGKNYPTKEEFSESGFCIFLNTGNIKNDQFDFSNCDFISQKKDEMLRKGKLKRNDIVLTTRGTVGAIALYHRKTQPDHIRINSGMIIIRPNSRISPHFLYYTLCSEPLKKQYLLYSSGSAQPQLPIKDFRKITIDIPPLPIQRKIAAVLSAYDDLIENNTRRIAILERMAEEIYREWFVRMRFPGHERVKFQKGVPEGWEIKKLGEILTLEYGKALKQDDRDDGQYPVYGSSGIVGYHSKYFCKSPGIIVGRKGNVGSIYWSNDHFYPIDTVYFVKSDYPLFYIYFLCQTMNFINNDAAVPGLNRQQAYSNSCYLPSNELINKFSDTVKPIFQLIDKISKKISALKQSRNLLLSRLMSGRLAVDDRDIRFPPGMMAENSQSQESGGPYHDLDHLAGGWSDEETQEFLQNTAMFEEIDER